MSLTDTTTQLGALAAGLCQDADIRLEISPADVWAWDPVRRVIIVSGPNLITKGDAYCAGVLAHEVSHYYISRYVWFSVVFPHFKILRFLLNAIEDPRVNTWIRRRYPGTSPWLRVVADLDMRTPDPTPIPAVMRFGFECAREEWLQWTPAHTLGHLTQEVADALDETRDARRQFAEMLPPPNLDPLAAGSDLLQRYREQVWPRLSREAPRTLPSAREQAVRWSVLQSLQIAEDKILPVAKRLLKNDIDRLANLMRDDPETQRSARDALQEGDGKRVRELIAASTSKSPERKGRPGEWEPRPELRVLGLSLVEAWLDDWRGQNRDSPLADPHGRTDRDLPAGPPRESRPGHRSRRRSRAGTELPPQPPPGLHTIPLPRDITPYEHVLIEIAPQINHLARIIERELRPVQRLGERSGYPSGYKLDLRRLMSYHADVRSWNKLWMRKTVPARWSVVFSLLVDLSGSMQGEKAKAAVAGSVLLAETLHRLGVPFLINGFQDVVIPFCAVGEGLTSDVRGRLAQMPQEVDGNRENGNNKPSYNDDGPCLKQAATEVLSLRYDERILIVISDGLPEGAHSSADDLRDTIADLTNYGHGLQLIGIGLGPDTEHVSEFYPRSVANVAVHRLAEEIGAVIREALRTDERRTTREEPRGRS